MRRALVVLAALCGLLLATGGSASATTLPTIALPAGCTVKAPTVGSLTLSGQTYPTVTSYPMTCTAASGYVVTRMSSGDQFWSISKSKWLNATTYNWLFSSIYYGVVCQIGYYGPENTPGCAGPIPAGTKWRGQALYTLTATATGQQDYVRKFTPAQIAA